jgi:hypothetical protein
MTPEIPITANVLNRLDYRILPRAISCSSFFTEIIEDENSGRDVSKATTVSPMTISLTPKYIAIYTASQTKIRELMIRRINPIKSHNTAPPTGL